MMTRLIAEIASTVVTIFIEAAPFLLLGSLLGALVEEYGTAERIARFLPKSRAAGIALGIAAGIVLPICECGSVPLARRFLRKGVPPHVVLPYMYAAPVVNPVVIISTFIAFRGDALMTLGRVAMVLPAAILIGILHARMVPRDLLRPAHLSSGGYTHGHNTGARGAYARTGAARLGAILRHTGIDFLDMGRFLLLGALCAAAFRVAVPSGLLMSFGSNPVLSIPVMMGLAIGLSVCSEADAFVAASFGFFPAAARLAFVAVGPMVDLKLISLYGSTFKRPVALRLIIVPVVTVFCVALAARGLAGVL